MRCLPRRRVPQREWNQPEERKKEREVTNKKTGSLELAKPFDIRHGAR